MLDNFLLQRCIIRQEKTKYKYIFMEKQGEMIKFL